jgi:hypothetical protein
MCPMSMDDASALSGYRDSPHSIGFSGGQLPLYVEGSSAPDFPLRSSVAERYHSFTQEVSV